MVAIVLISLPFYSAGNASASENTICNNGAECACGAGALASCIGWYASEPS